MPARFDYVSVGELSRLTLTDEQLSTLVEFAKVSHPIVAAYWDDDIAAVVGFIPGSLMSDTAYVWVHATSVLRQHGVAFGRLARRYIWHHGFNVLIGHCIGEFGIPWVRSLGAEFEPAVAGIVPFKIVRS